jgi:Sec-independent protein translocase protein TatA
MQIFNVGPLELIFILIIMILVLGPKGMVQSARELGKFIRKITRSPIWKDVVDTSNEIRDLPNKIIREAGIEKEIDELRRNTQSTLNPNIYPKEDLKADQKQNPAETHPMKKSSRNARKTSFPRKPDQKRKKTKQVSQKPSVNKKE